MRKKRLLKILALVLIGGAVVATLVACGSAPKTPKGAKLNLEGFKQTFRDDFDGDSFDSAKWSPSAYWDGDSEHVRRGGYWDPEQVSVENGNLVISTEYKEDGKYGAGYYTGMLNTKGLFEQAGGYFEIRCKVPAMDGAWAAFWLLNSGMRSVGTKGVDGSEVDIFESQAHSLKGDFKNSISHAVHYNGYGDDLKSKGSGAFAVTDPYNEFHTYGLLWEGNSFTFYIDNVESWKFKAPGVSQKPEYMILSVEVLGEDGVATEKDGWCGNITDTPKENFPTEFIVDYIAVFQSPDTTLDK